MCIYAFTRDCVRECLSLKVTKNRFAAALHILGGFFLRSLCAFCTTFEFQRYNKRETNEQITMKETKYEMAICAPCVCAHTPIDPTRERASEHVLHLTSRLFGVLCVQCSFAPNRSKHAKMQ